MLTEWDETKTKYKIFSNNLGMGTKFIGFNHLPFNKS